MIGRYRPLSFFAIIFLTKYYFLGTQCEKLVEAFGFVHISAGDCLREERNTQSKDAELINQVILIKIQKKN